MRVAITGSTGFIGRAVLAEALRRNCEVTALGRRAPAQPGVGFREWDLEGPAEPLPRSNCDALIHIAADMRPQTRAMTENGEVDRVGKLFESLPDSARIIFISSQASRPDAPTRYGRVKHQIEALVQRRNGIIIRPGMVYSDRRQNDLHSRVRHIVAKLPAIPDFLPRPIVQPIHVDDLARAIVRCAKPDAAPGTYCLGDIEGLTFTDYLRLIARIQVKGWRPAVPLPAALVSAALPALRLLPFASGVDPASLKSLLSSKPMPTARDLAALGVELRPFRRGLRPSGRSQELIAEGRAMASYLLGRKPPLNLIKRYVLAIRRVRDGEPMYLRMPLVAFPGLIRLCENRGFIPGRGDSEFEKRLDIATRIVENSVAGAEQFVQARPRSIPGAGLSMISAISADVFFQVVRLLVKPNARDKR